MEEEARLSAMEEDEDRIEPNKVVVEEPTIEVYDPEEAEEAIEDRTADEEEER